LKEWRREEPRFLVRIFLSRRSWSLPPALSTPPEPAEEGSAGWSLAVRRDAGRSEQVAFGASAQAPFFPVWPLAQPNIPRRGSSPITCCQRITPKTTRHGVEIQSTRRPHAPPAAETASLRMEQRPWKNIHRTLPGAGLIQDVHHRPVHVAACDLARSTRDRPRSITTTANWASRTSP
jgi:hypothetical protein